MTAEEQKAATEAAAKAASEKKAETDKSKTKEGVEEADEEEEGEEEPEGDPKARIAALNAESKKHRLAAKAARKENEQLKADKERQDKALAILQGKDKPDLDPLEQVKKSSDAKMRNAFLKAAVAAAAGADAHDVGTVFEIAKSKLAGVTVDLDTEEVDADELKEVLDELRESKPFLFKGKDETTLDPNAKTKKGVKLPPDNGRAAGGANHYQTYQQLLAQNRTGEAQEYYNKNRAAILVQMKLNPNLG